MMIRHFKVEEYQYEMQILHVEKLSCMFSKRNSSQFQLEWRLRFFSVVYSI